MNPYMRRNISKSKMIVYVYISVMLVAVVSGQFILKYGLSKLGEMPTRVCDGAFFLLRALLSPLVILSLFLAFIAALAWIAAVSKVELSFAYPFTSLGYILVLLLSSLILKEQIPMMRWVGVFIIGIGVFVVSRS